MLAGNPSSSSDAWKGAQGKRTRPGYSPWKVGKLGISRPKGAGQLMLPGERAVGDEPSH